MRYRELLSWASAGGRNEHFPAPGNWDEKTKIFRKSEVGILIPINWFNFCNNTLFTGMALTLHKSQLHYSGVMQWWACSSLMTTPSSAESRCQLASALFYCCPLLRWQWHGNESQRFNSSCDSYRVFPHVTVDLRHLWQVMQRDSHFWQR